MINMSPWIAALSRAVFVASTAMHFFTVKMNWLCPNTAQPGEVEAQIPFSALTQEQRCTKTLQFWGLLGFARS